MSEDIQTLNKGCVRFKSGYIPGESEIREAMDRAMIMQLNLLPVARKMVLEEDSERQAKELLVKLAEYKPLAKIEELEEQNYNMIDERLNNGAGKFNREEEKKEQQEKSEARFSLKERLAAKQKEATQGNNKDTKELEKSKNSHREM